MNSLFVLSGTIHINAIQCSKEEKRPLRGIWAYTDDRTNLDGVPTYGWSDKSISDFIDSL